MTWDRWLYLIVFGVLMFGLYQLAKWGTGHWGWWFSIGAVAVFLLIGWLIDRRSKSEDSE